MVRSKDSSASHLDGNGGVNQTDMGRVARQEVWLPVALLFAMSGDVVCSLPPITLSRIGTKPEKRRQSVILGAGGSTRCICGGYSCRSVLQRIDPP